MKSLTDYLLTAAAAEYLGVAQNTLRKWAGRGDIPMHRNPANGYRLFKWSDVDRLRNRNAKPDTITKKFLRVESRRRGNQEIGPLFLTLGLVR